MPRAFLVTLSILLICGSTLGAERPLQGLLCRQLFAFMNDLPGVLAGLAEAGRGRRIVTGQRTPGGYTLDQHVKDGRAAEDIQRAMGCRRAAKTKRPARRSAGQNVRRRRKLHQTIKSQQARTLFFLTWAPKGQPQMQEGLNQAYFSLAKAHASQHRAGRYGVAMGLDRRIMRWNSTCETAAIPAPMALTWPPACSTPPYWIRTRWAFLLKSRRGAGPC